MSYQNNGSGLFGIINLLSSGTNLPTPIKAIRLIGIVLTGILALSIPYTQSGSGNPLLTQIFGFNLLVFALCIVVLGLWSLAQWQHTTIGRVVLRLLLYVFIPAIILTAIVITIAFILHAPGLQQ